MFATQPPALGELGLSDAATPAYDYTANGVSKPQKSC